MPGCWRFSPPSGAIRAPHPARPDRPGWAGDRTQRRAPPRPPARRDPACARCSRCAPAGRAGAASRSGHHHEVLLAVVSLRALFACVGFWASSAESGLLLIDAKTADFVAPDKCGCDDMRWHRHPFPPHRRPGTPHDDFLSVTGELQNPIGRTLSGPPSSIPRFPPSRFIQRLPTGALPSSTLIS